MNHTDNWEKEIRKEWREEIKRWPNMDALGSADWWIEKLRTELQALHDEVGEMKELHRHNSIPSYTADLEGGCRACVKNQGIIEIQEIIKKKL